GRPLAGHAAQDPARAPGGRVRAPRGNAHAPGRRAHRGGNQPGPGRDGEGKTLPRGPLLPPQRHHRPRAALARASRGHPRPRSASPAATRRRRRSYSGSTCARWRASSNVATTTSWRAATGREGPPVDPRVSAARLRRRGRRGRSARAGAGEADGRRGSLLRRAGRRRGGGGDLGARLHALGSDRRQGRAPLRARAGDAVDRDQFRRTENRDVLARYGIREPYVLFVGRITDQKGIFHLLEAAPRLPSGVQVVLCASAPDTPEIEARLRKAVPEHPNVVWIGAMLPVPDVVQLYSHAAVFACPSVYEPFGLINLEAMACETPVVASGVGGILEVVDDGKTGLLVEPGRPDVLAAALGSLLADRQRAR